MIRMPHWPVEHKPIDLGLDRIRALLARLEHPERKLSPVVHIAGTNGKGSTLAFVRAMLEAAGYKAHVYTSPHLVVFNERIVLAGKPIGDDFLYDALEECRKKAEGIPLTFFEGTTAAALLAFSKVPADVVLLETGLGGRLDATNVIAKPSLTILTPISFDHMEYLGNALAQIAWEKAAIMKPGVPCVSSRQKKTAREALEKFSKEIGAPLFMQGREWNIRAVENGLRYEDERGILMLPLPSLPGKHQYANAGLAVAALRRLKDFAISDAAITKGILHAQWPGRLQRLKGPEGHEIWLDGAHNPDGAKALAAHVKTWKQPVYLIVGMLKNRTPSDFLLPFAGHVSGCYAVPVPGENSHASGDIAAAAKTLGMASFEMKNVADAIAAIAAKNTPGRIVICGSLYLVGSALEENG